MSRELSMCECQRIMCIYFFPFLHSDNDFPHEALKTMHILVWLNDFVMIIITLVNSSIAWTLKLKLFNEYNLLFTLCFSP